MPVNTFKDIPKASDIIATSQGDIEGNFLYLANTLGTSLNASKDHQISVGGTDTASFEGRHRQVSLNNQVVANVTPAFTDGATVALFASGGDLAVTFPSFGAAATLLSVNSKPPVNLAIGSSWLPGGMLIQWGSITGTPIVNGQAVTFVTPFLAGSPFSITLGPASSSTNDKTISITTGSVSTTGFTVSCSGSSSFQTLYWMAIGRGV